MTRIVLTPIAVLLMSCTVIDDQREIRLTDEASERGVNYIYQSGMTPDFRIPEIMGGGVALLDSDQDGDLDLYFVQGGLLSEGGSEIPNALFTNDGSGHFESVDGGDSTKDLGYGMGVSVGDIDGDGYPDVFVTQLGKNKLLRNLGANTFEDISDSAGFSRLDWSTATALADFDADGDLDLWVVNYIEWHESIEIECYQSMLGSRDYCAPTFYNRPAQDRLYLNNGEGRFIDATERAGLKGIKGNGLGNVVVDFNGDGLLDVFVANDTSPNHLWINQGDGTFQEEAELWNCAIDLHGVARAGMGVAAIDMDDDSDQDLMVVNITTEPDYVFRNEGEFFTDIASQIGLSIASQRYTRFGLVIADLNNDTWLDIYQANGAVARLSNPHEGDLFAEPNALYVGNSSGQFGAPIYTEAIQTSRGAAQGDLNSDGLLDIVVVNRDAEPNVLINKSGSGNWLMLDLRDTNGGVAIGSRVSLQVGERRIFRTVMTSGSYLSSHDHRIHIGLGNNEVVTDIEVEWLTGGSTAIESLEANQIHRIDQT